MVTSDGDYAAHVLKLDTGSMALPWPECGGDWNRHSTQPLLPNGEDSSNTLSSARLSSIGDTRFRCLAQPASLMPRSSRRSG